MAEDSLHLFLRRLRHARGVAEAGGLSDAELLARFAGGRDEASFEVLVWRHGALRQVEDAAERLRRLQGGAPGPGPDAARQAGVEQKVERLLRELTELRRELQRRPARDE